MIPLLCISFSDTTLFLNHYRVAHEIFRQWEAIFFRRKNEIQPPLFIRKNFSKPEVFSKTKRILHKNFRQCETESYDGNTWYLLISISYFDYPKTSETLKGCPRLCPALWDLKLLTEKRDTPIIHKLFRYHKFSGTLQGRSRMFSTLWDHSFSMEKCHAPPFSSVKTFLNRKFSQKQ